MCRSPHRIGYFKAGPALDGTFCGNSSVSKIIKSFNCFFHSYCNKKILLTKGSLWVLIVKNLRKTLSFSF